MALARASLEYIRVDKAVRCERLRYADYGKGRVCATSTLLYRLNLGDDLSG